MRLLTAGAVLLLTALTASAASPQAATDPGRRVLDPGTRATLNGILGPTRVKLPLGDAGLLDVELERFAVTTDRTRFLVRRADGRETPLAFDPDDVVLLRGGVVDRPGSTAFVALGDFGVRGTVGLGGEQYAITGAASGPVAVMPAVGSVGTPPVDVCGLPDDGDVTLAGTAPGSANPGEIRHLAIAVETDFEYYQLFGDADAATAYIIALYGAISDIYLRDVNTHLEVTFVRIWETHEDMFDEPDPLVPFRDYWNAYEGGVFRDVAQFITGRRNLPYGGVAWLNGLCNDNSYSVCGYILGGLADPTIPGSANWDIVVTAHELGHNCGTSHTHSYGIDNCAGGDNQRGSIMSYCHTTAGGTANIDLRFHREIQPIMESYIAGVSCAMNDCNLNNISDLFEMLFDGNGNGVLDECEDCNGNGTLDSSDIAGGASFDVNVNGVPDECEDDCTEDGIPDVHQIALGEFDDFNGDNVPDQCELDCDGDGTSDYTQIQADMSLDLDRDGLLDACQDCDGNGVPDLQDLAGGMHVWVGSATLGGMREFHGSTGVAVKTAFGLGLGEVMDVLIAPSGAVLASASSGRVASFDSVTGAYTGDFVATGAGGLTDPAGMAWSPSGTLLVVDRASGAVLEYDGGDGSFLGALVPPTSPLLSPFGIAYGPAGSLFVTSVDGFDLDGLVHEFDGATGAHLGVHVSTGSGGLREPRGLLFKPDGNLLAASFGSGAVLEYDGATGAYIARFDMGGNSSGFWGLEQPWGLRLAPRGDVVLVSSHAGNAAIHGYDLETGLFMRSFYVLSAEIDAPTGFAAMPPGPSDCNMNFRHDACDIAAGLLADADDNGVPDACQCAADTNGDLVVDVNDLVEVITSWGPCPGCPGDVNGDGTVDVNDLNDIVLAWGSCGAG